MRLGAGTLAGKGGPKDVIDKPRSHHAATAGSPSLSLAPVHLRLHRVRVPPAAVVALCSAAGRPAHQQPARHDDEGVGMRSGDDQTASLSTELGLPCPGAVRGQDRDQPRAPQRGFTDRVGTLFEAAYNWAPRSPLPNPARGASHRPARARGPRGPPHHRGRLARPPWVYPSLRLSYQARDIDHLGVSGGLGLNFDW